MWVHHTVTYGLVRCLVHYQRGVPIEILAKTIERFTQTSALVTGNGIMILHITPLRLPKGGVKIWDHCCSLYNGELWNVKLRLWIAGSYLCWVKWYFKVPFSWYVSLWLLFRFQHELQEKDKVIETLQLRLKSKAEMHSVALSPFSSPNKRFVETQTSPRQVSAATPHQKDSSYTKYPPSSNLRILQTFCLIMREKTTTTSVCVLFGNAKWL